ncbi:hypothetical protein H0H92_002143 [Tricholoma furcatifolium]|nr:hypothetical protein H0H92_002143 [Tricholoma furcatifolium]
MLTRRVFYTLNSRFWDEPSSVEILFTILNFVTCIPVFLAVGGFSLYHLYCLLGNSTTIEGWEKNKVATMVRRGKLREVKFPYDLGKRKNVDSVLGPNVLFWCWPRTALGNGIRFDIKDSDGGPDLWPPSGPTHDYDSPEQDFVLPPTPWTYENGGVNPNLEATNSQRRLIKRSNPSYRRATGVSALPPYHPDYQEPTDNDLIEDSESTDEECNRQGPLVRSGSEGYEVRPVDREELLRRYLLEIGQEPGRYKYYIPTPDEDSDGDSDTPLAAVVDKIERKEHLE